MPQAFESQVDGSAATPALPKRHGPSGPRPVVLYEYGPRDSRRGILRAYVT